MSPRLFNRYYKEVLSVLVSQVQATGVLKNPYNDISKLIASTNQLLLTEMISEASAMFSGKTFYYHKTPVTLTGVFINEHNNLKAFIIDEIGITSCHLDLLRTS